MRYGGKWLSLGMLSGVAGGMLACAPLYDPPRGTLDAPPGQGMARMQVLPEMALEPAHLERHADAMEIAAGEVRAHVREMQALGGEGRRTRMMDHTAHVAWLLSAVTRHTTDMYQRFGLTEDEVASLYGMGREEHRRMVEELRALRAEAGHLQTAPDIELDATMRSHLDAVEAMAGTVERGAERVRRAG